MMTLCALLVVNGVALYAFVAETTELRAASIVLTGFGLLALLVAVEGFRSGSRWAWNATWVVVGMLAVLTAQEATGSEPSIGVWYGVLTVAALVAQVLARGRPAA